MSKLRYKYKILLLDKQFSVKKMKNFLIILNQNLSEMKRCSMRRVGTIEGVGGGRVSPGFVLQLTTLLQSKNI